MTSPPVTCPTCSAILGRYQGDRFLMTANRPGGGFRYTLGKVELKCCREWHVIPPSAVASATEGDPYAGAYPPPASAPVSAGAGVVPTPTPERNAS